MRYEPASKLPTATSCQSGTKALVAATKAAYPELLSGTGGYGCFNHRHIAGSTAWSLHAEGRAIDTGVAYRYHDLGWKYACELVAHRTIYGVMRVIWDRHIWSVERINEWKPLNPKLNPHTDHVHCEQFWVDALRPSTVVLEYTEALRASRSA